MQWRKATRGAQRFLGRALPPSPAGGQARAKRKLFAKPRQRTRVFRICKGSSGRGTPRRRRYAIVRYAIARVRCDIRKSPASNIRKTRVPRRESEKTFSAGWRETSRLEMGRQRSRTSLRMGRQQRKLPGLLFRREKRTAAGTGAKPPALGTRMFHRPFHEQLTFSRVLPCSAAENVKDSRRLANGYRPDIARSRRDDYRDER